MTFSPNNKQTNKQTHEQQDPKDLPYMQRPGGAPDGSDLKKGGGMKFSFGAKKKAAEKPAPEPEKKKNWWTL